MTAPIRVLLVDDHDLVRHGLAAILAAAPAIQIVGEVADGPTAVQVARELTPDIVLMDVEMLGGTASPPPAPSWPPAPQHG